MTPEYERTVRGLFDQILKFPKPDDHECVSCRIISDEVEGGLCPDCFEKLEDGVWTTV